MFHKKTLRMLFMGKVHFDEDVNHNYRQVCFKRNRSHSQGQVHFDENVKHN
jgi:hypothetical protein